MPILYSSIYLSPTVKLNVNKAELLLFRTSAIIKALSQFNKAPIKRKSNE